MKTPAVGVAGAAGDWPDDTMGLEACERRLENRGFMTSVLARIKRPALDGSSDFREKDGLQLQAGRRDGTRCCRGDCERGRNQPGVALEQPATGRVGETVFDCACQHGRPANFKQKQTHQQRRSGNRLFSGFLNASAPRGHDAKNRGALTGVRAIASRAPEIGRARNRYEPGNGVQPRFERPAEPGGSRVPRGVRG